MGKHFDELSKSFASGMSRRASLKRFVAGMAGGLLAGRVAQVAEAGPIGCRGICREGGFTKGALGRCTGECAKCEARGGFFVVNNSTPLCFS